MNVSAISLGTEHLRRPPSKVKKVVAKALDAGVNYIDMVFNLTEQLAAYSAAIEGRGGCYAGPPPRILREEQAVL